MLKNFKTISLLVLLFVTAVDFFVYLRVHDINAEAKLQFVLETPREGVFDTKVAYVSGAVKKPGVYNIDEETRVVDLIELAKGYKQNADLGYVNQQLNLAALVKDEQQVFIPFQQSNQPQSPGVASTGSKINLNTATQSELESLTGVGPATAEKIIANRPFATVQDVLNVPGIGETTLANFINDVEI